MPGIKELSKIASSLSVLYVEDEKDIAKLFINYLSKIFDNVTYSQNGNNALEKYNDGYFDIVISDINMPKMNGLELARNIRNLNEKQNIIFITAYSEEKILLESIKIGIDGYLIKPIDFNEVNSLLLKNCISIRNEYENSINIKKQKSLMSHISQKNTLLEQYTNVIDKVAIVSKTDLRGTITYANDIFCEVAKYKREELIGQAHNIIRHPDMPKSAFKDMWDTIESGSMWHGKVKNRAKDGSAYYVQASVFPLYENDDKKVIGYIAIRFLTTDEENEKRDFKKKVISNLSEIRKKESELKANNSLYKKEIVYLKNTITTLSNKSNKDNKNILSQNNQIKYYEEQQVTSNNKILNLLEKKKIELEHHIDSNKKLKNEKDELVKKNNKLTEYIETLEYDNKSLRENITDKNKKINDFSIIINDIGRNI